MGTAMLELGYFLHKETQHSQHSYLNTNPLQGSIVQGILTNTKKQIKE